MIASASDSVRAWLSRHPAQLAHLSNQREPERHRAEAHLLDRLLVVVEPFVG